eukprot:scaffold11755_cov18-Tisochrysis_lutea.AAC.3
MLCIDLMAYEMPELNEDQQCWLREYLMHWLSIYMNNGMTQAGVTAVLLGEKGRMGGASSMAAPCFAFLFQVHAECSEAAGGQTSCISSRTSLR